MSEDARFEDGADRPIRLKAMEPEEVPVIAALLQDAVLPISEMKWDTNRRRFALLVNRFRWEDKEQAEARGRPFERVQSVLAVEDVKSVLTQGIDRSDSDTIISILTLQFEPGEDGAGRVILTLAGDGAVAVDVEALELTLRDVTRPYIAPSRKAPEHSA